MSGVGGRVARHASRGYRPRGHIQMTRKRKMREEGKVVSWNSLGYGLLSCDKEREVHVSRDSLVNGGKLTPGKPVEFDLSYGERYAAL